ncbi:MAG: hypothetical protein EA400_00850 [Chromatiaceae bacterium]|nr:MAG: hypothetical protein EA400_00850 [Chromatiaceae bacterium]
MGAAGKSDHAIERTLVIGRHLADRKIQYSLSTADPTRTSIARLAYMQAQRYWVERAFQAAKSELGMLDDQVQKWTAWHQQLALVLLALAFLVKERSLYQAAHPLLSSRDLRLMSMALLRNDPAAVDRRMGQWYIRHAQRRRDRERCHRIASTV